MEEELLLAILIKDKARELPLFLECIEKQIYDKKKISLYIRSNDNKDNSIEIIEEWLNRVGDEYKSIYKNYENINENIKNLGSHEWTEERFKILADIRQESINYAMERNMHYIVVDCDNFLKNKAFLSLIKCNLPVVGPFLKLPSKIRNDPNLLNNQTCGPRYSNYHAKADCNGYFLNTNYDPIFDRIFKGYIEVDVIHCTYLIRKEYLKFCKYFEGEYKLHINGSKYRNEYVVFSDYLRKYGIKQYIDNTIVQGVLLLLKDNCENVITYSDVVNEY